MSFSATFHKIQGRTVPQLLLFLHYLRRHFLMTFPQFLVGFSRVADAVSDLRILVGNHLQTHMALKLLQDITNNAGFVIWVRGFAYDEETQVYHGLWSRDRCLHNLRELAQTWQDELRDKPSHNPNLSALIATQTTRPFLPVKRRRQTTAHGGLPATPRLPVSAPRVPVSKPLKTPLTAVHSGWSQTLVEFRTQALVTPDAHGLPAYGFIRAFLHSVAGYASEVSRHLDVQLSEWSTVVRWAHSDSDKLSSKAKAILYAGEIPLVKQIAFLQQLSDAHAVTGDTPLMTAGGPPIPNVRNSCFAAVVAHTLFALPFLGVLLANVKANSGRVATAVHELLVDMAAVNRTTPVSVTALRSALSSVHTPFHSQAHHDPSEFLIAMIDKLESVTNLSAGIKSAFYHTIHHLKTEKLYQCPEVGYAPALLSQINIPNPNADDTPVSLDELFGDDLWNSRIEDSPCATCKVNHTYTMERYLELSSLPQTLILRINRDSYSHLLQRPIKRLFQLSYSDFLHIVPSTDNPLLGRLSQTLNIDQNLPHSVYVLVAVIKHQGEESGEGHYVSCTRRIDENQNFAVTDNGSKLCAPWHRQNDSQITANVSPSSVYGTSNTFDTASVLVFTKLTSVQRASLIEVESAPPHPVPDTETEPNVPEGERGTYYMDALSQLATKFRSLVMKQRVSSHEKGNLPKVSSNRISNLPGGGPVKNSVDVFVLPGPESLAEFIWVNGFSFQRTVLPRLHPGIPQPFSAMNYFLQDFLVRQVSTHDKRNEISILHCDFYFAAQTVPITALLKQMKILVIVGANPWTMSIFDRSRPKIVHCCFLKDANHLPAINARRDCIERDLWTFMELQELVVQEKRYSNTHSDLGVYIIQLAKAVVQRYLQAESPALADLLNCDVSAKEYAVFSSNMQQQMASAFHVENNKNVLYKTINLTTVDLTDYTPSQKNLNFSPEDASTVSTLQAGTWAPFTKYGMDITPANLNCLWGTRWLNDHVMNFFLQLVEIRSQKPGAPARVKCMNTFFYTKLALNGYNYGNVASWFTDTDLFALDYIFVPIHVGLVSYIQVSYGHLILCL
jgi:hypothetical protein